MTGKSQAYIVGASGSIHLYNEGQLTSQKVSGVNANLNAVSFDPQNNTGFIAGNGGTLLKTTDGQSWEQLLSPEPNPTNWVAYTDPAHNNHTVNLNAIYAHDRAIVYAAGNEGVLLKSTDGGASWSRRQSGTTANLSDIAFKDSETAILGGSSSTAMHLTDKRERFSSYFYYDRLGRLVAAQNSKQCSMYPPRYSYTCYDALGRTIETGELASRTAPEEGLLNSDRFPDNWSMERYQVVRTQYDEPLSDDISQLFANEHQNLRNRVASATYQEEYDANSTVYNHATHYIYDIHGNVKELVQDNPDSPYGMRYKRIRYEYDLISGNVKKVIYQPAEPGGPPDQFYHKYEYDADNRITKVYTSLDGFIWDNDASYQYYRHGPLARTEIGDLKVQGVDYAYTLQGWIKGVNSNVLNSADDMGGDGNNDFAQDAFGYSLHYNTNDYKPIGGSSAESFLSAVAVGTPVTSLYNGNISRMATAISESVTNGHLLNLGTQVRNFQYDELNRLVESNKVSGKGVSDAYATTYSYDANGNINNLTRKDGNGLMMDELTYHYTKDGNNKLLNNRLLHVNDDATESAETADLKDQRRDYAQNNPGTQNYKYDKIGNLIADEQEEIAEIKWNVQGKIQEIIRTPSSLKSDLVFKYDAMGNRVSKTEKLKNTLPDETTELTTYYVRDAQGNVMAVYEGKTGPSSSVPGQYNSSLYLKEQHIYGASRLGMRQPNKMLFFRAAAAHGASIARWLGESSRVLGEKNFEMTSHTGNVLAVVSDKKLLNNEPDVIATYDYYPFGQLLPLRYYKPDIYRYGFGGHEKLDEITGSSGTVYSTETRLYDVRLGLWRGVDELFTKYPSWSSYNYVKNNPIKYIDPDGREIKLAGTAAERQTSLTHLQRLTNDKLSMRTDGTVIIVRMGGENSGKALTSGSELIRDLNKKGSGERTVTISIGAAGSGNSESHLSTNSTNGVGTDSNVSFDPTSNPSILTKDPVTGNVSGATRPNEIGLGHELIHAERAMTGKSATGTTTQTYKDAAGNMTTPTPVRNEEVETVGTQGTHKYNENKLRREQGLNERGAY